MAQHPTRQSLQRTAAAAAVIALALATAQVVPMLDADDPIISSPNGTGQPMPEGFEQLGPRSSVDQADHSIAAAGANASIAPGVGDAVLKPGTTAMDLARSFIGQGEAKHAKVIGAFIVQMTGSKLDIRETPWCAAFVNAILKASGTDGTGSLSARSFLKFGTATDAPRAGDVAVFSRGDPNGRLGHVGFYAWEVERNGQTYVRVVGGNQGDSVSEQLYPKSRLLGYRRPPTVKVG
jgi:uncharacterized protein (TIGR02594 family)